MLLAKKKLQNNIAEYLLYMYQTEDLMRSYDMNIERIDQNLISLLPCDKSEKEELKQWYTSIIDQIKKEGIENSGH